MAFERMEFHLEKRVPKPCIFFWRMNWFSKERDVCEKPLVRKREREKERKREAKNQKGVYCGRWVYSKTFGVFFFGLFS